MSSVFLLILRYFSKRYYNTVIGRPRQASVSRGFCSGGGDPTGARGVLPCPDIITASVFLANDLSAGTGFSVWTLCAAGSDIIRAFGILGFLTT